MDICQFSVVLYTVYWAKNFVLRLLFRKTKNDIYIYDNQEKNFFWIAFGFCLYQFIYIKTATWSKYLQFFNLQVKRKCRGNKMIYKQWTWNKKGMKRYNLSKIRINYYNINAWWKELEKYLMSVVKFISSKNKG